METCQHCRAEQEDQSRRTFLKRALGVAGATLALNFLPAEFLRRTASAATNAGKTLVVVFQRGGNDGLNTIVPYIDPQYYSVRPSALSGAGKIGIPPPGGGDGAGIDLRGTGFAMHPAIQPFLDLYNNNTLAIVTQAGFAGSTQSHFTDQDIIERGLFQATDGWLNRYLQAVGAIGAPVIRAAGMGSDLADSLRGSTIVPALNDLSALSFVRLNSAKAPGVEPQSSLWTRPCIDEHEFLQRARSYLRPRHVESRGSDRSDRPGSSPERCCVSQYLL